MIKFKNQDTNSTHPLLCKARILLSRQQTRVEIVGKENVKDDPTYLQLGEEIRKINKQYWNE